MPTLQTALSQNNIGPCLRLWARGSPAFRFFRLPRDRGGWRADKAHGLDRQAGMPGSRPGLGVKRHAPRLAARQRGIFGLRLISGRAAPGAVCPWRVVPEPARGSGVRPPRPQVSLPFPALQNASGRRPSKSGSGWPKHNYAESEVKHYFSPQAYFFMVNNDASTSPPVVPANPRLREDRRGDPVNAIPSTGAVILAISASGILGPRFRGDDSGG